MSAAVQDATQESLRYPIGRFSVPSHVSDDNLKKWIAAFESLPSELAKSIENLTESQLDTPYRHGGWTVRQVVHHVADSHASAYTRIRLALTENSPAMPQYDQNAWAQLSDAKSAPLFFSLPLIEALHRRFALLLRCLTPEQWERTIVYPVRGELSLRALVGVYAWHGRHHTAHITELRKRNGW
jgi:hypothetical protein